VGNRIRITRAPVSVFYEGAVVEPDPIGALGPEDGVDNFEALAAYETSDGATRLLILSDDNFSQRQKTLLLEFELRDR
ncbi:MAG: hypothetical protein AAGJ87_09695, partial [Pseudomonadota bacterium]